MRSEIDEFGDSYCDDLDTADLVQVRYGWVAVYTAILSSSCRRAQLLDLGHALNDTASFTQSTPWNDDPNCCAVRLLVSPLACARSD
jgi:hypothetical protein